MKIKRILTIVLVVFVVGSIVYMIVRENRAESITPGEPAGEAVRERATPISVGAERTLKATHTLIVYYFLGNKRCPTCHKLENYAKEALETYFPEELGSGRIQWKPVNVDIAENEHFVEDYQLVTKAIILSAMTTGKETTWKNLNQIWDLVADKSRYMEYIHESITKLLEAQNS